MGNDRLPRVCPFAALHMKSNTEWMRITPSEYQLANLFLFRQKDTFFCHKVWFPPVHRFLPYVHLATAKQSLFPNLRNLQSRGGLK